MDCTLMHKNVPVLDIEIDNDDAYILKIQKLHDGEHLPIGVSEQGSPNRTLLNEWFHGRSIPASRDNLESALITLGIQSPYQLLTKCYGLSLSDHYWISPKGSELTWDAINFFENDFSRDIGEILFGDKSKNVNKINMLSPDNTTDGWLQKKWIIIDSIRYLMKGSGSGFEQEPFNEVAATAIMRRLNISHVPYTMIFNGGKPYSLCKNFLTPETELIPAWRVRKTLKQSNNDSDLIHLLRCCENLGIPDVRINLDKMLVLDYIVENEDRHYNNFGFIRNADTLEWLGFAPIYDSGTSLWHDDPHVGHRKESKPFKSSHIEQIKLVKDLEWFALEALEGIKDECEEIFAKSNKVMPERWVSIGDAVWERGKLIGQQNESGLQRYQA